MQAETKTTNIKNQGITPRPRLLLPPPLPRPFPKKQKTESNNEEHERFNATFEQEQFERQAESLRKVRAEAPLLFFFGFLGGGFRV